jgi:hypothetical protein
MIKTKLTIEGAKDDRLARYRMFCILTDTDQNPEVIAAISSNEGVYFVILEWYNMSQLNESINALYSAADKINDNDDDTNNIKVSSWDQWIQEGLLTIGTYITLELTEDKPAPAPAPAPAEAPGEQSILVELTTSELALISTSLKVYGMQLMIVVENSITKAADNYKYEADQAFLLDQNKFSNGKYQEVSNG